MLALIPVDFTVGRCCRLHISVCIVKFALLFFQDRGDLHSRICRLEGVESVVALVNEVGLFEVLEGLVFVLHSQV